MSIYSSREPFNDDPQPWDGGPSGRTLGWPPDSELGRAMLNTAWLYDPRPKFERPQNNPTNPILTEFRRSAPWDIAKAAAIEVRWLSGTRTAPVPATATHAQVDHARKVLTRLAALKEES